MELNININGRHVHMILFVLVLGFASVLVFSQGTPIQGHHAEEITPGTFGEGGDYIFPTGSKVGIGGTSPQADLDMGAGSIRLGGVTRTNWSTGTVYYREHNYPVPPKSVHDDHWGGGLGCESDDVLLGCYIKHRDGNNGCPEDNYLLGGCMYANVGAWGAWLVLSENADDHKCYLWRYGDYPCYTGTYTMVAKCLRL
ncbi:MAG: hypothetical protein U9M95_01415 [Candidatus Altiarchaeota archaeon]|nr:hypothetical protein [Candidatus Altiarchaeota archaeon]